MVSSQQECELFKMAAAGWTGGSAVEAAGAVEEGDISAHRVELLIFRNEIRKRRGNFLRGPCGNTFSQMIGGRPNLSADLIIVSSSNNNNNNNIKSINPLERSSSSWIKGISISIVFVLHFGDFGLGINSLILGRRRRQFVVAFYSRMGFFLSFT